MTCVKRETALPSRAGADGLDHNAAAHMRPRAPAPTPAAARNGGRVKHANAPPEGVYLPNNNRLAPHMRSPDYVQLSTAAAITLGIMPGRMFGCDHEGVSPDLMTLAKALGGGVMPIGATLGTRAVWEAVFSENPLAHTSTFGGNPLACAAGLAAIKVVEDEGLADRANEIGSVLRRGLEAAGGRFPDLVSDVRGQGLMLGVEFTMDDVGELTIAQMLKRGLVAAYTLNNRRVIRFEPPLILRIEEAEWAAETFGDALAETSEVLAALV